MNLTVDIGNTNVKLAVFDKEELIESGSFDNIPENKLVSDFLSNHISINQIIVSSVGSELAFEAILPKQTMIHLTHSTPIPIENLYKSTDTLGTDRIALAVAANNQFPNCNVLVIDAGTCITYDYVNAKNQYMGGSIAPGIGLRFKAMHTFTGRLPLVNAENVKSEVELTGNTTKTSMQSGVINGVIAEVAGIINAYLLKYDGLKVLLTGGNSYILENTLLSLFHLKKNLIFANPNLVHKGLNAILNYNVGR